MSGGLNLKLGLFGDEQLVGSLLKMDDRVDDVSPWFRMMHRWLESEVGKQFATEGKHLGPGSWKKLSPAYKAWKEREYPGRKILQREGDLLESLTRRGGQSVRHVTRKMLVFGSQVEHGKYHQKTRPMLHLDTTRKRQVTRSLGMFVVSDKVQPPGGFSGKGAK